MKRTVIIASVILMLFSGAGEAASEKWTVGFITGAEQGIQSGFIRMASQGLFKARQEHGFTVITETPKDVSQKAMGAAFQKMIDRKPDFILATGFQMSEHVRAFAPLHPEVRFLMCDVPIANLPNVMSVQFAAHEGSFLAGALAGWMTETGKVGVIGGVDVPPVIAFMAGFQQGVHHANPNVRAKAAFVSKIPDFSGFSTPEKGAELAESWYRDGADIIFAVAGTTGNGIIYQAKKSGKYAIGVDVDQDGMAEGHVLTSMLKRVDVAIYLAVSQIVRGEFQPGVRTYGLKEKGVGLTEMKYTRHLISDDVIRKLKDAEAKILSGEITVADGLDGK